MTRSEQMEVVREVLHGESFAVFAFAGADGEPPYSSVMFCAETEALDLVFATSAGTIKSDYLRTGAGACAQLDTRAVGIENMSKFARVTVQGRLEHVEDADRVADLHAVYTRKLPEAAVFLARPGVLTYVLHPSRIVFARGFGERFELDFGPS